MSTIVFTKKRIKRNIFLLRELMYRIRYGSRAPKYAERIYVNPQIIQQCIFGPTNFLSCSGSVININKKYKNINIYNTPRIKSSIDHWVYGVPWELTDDYKIMLNAIKSGKIWAGCKNEIDLRLRFEQLDSIFYEVKSSMRLKTMNELNNNSFREEGGILVCIGPNGKPLLFDGFHRFAISLILNLQIIPAQLGYVDKSAIDYLDNYRNP